MAIHTGSCKVCGGGTLEEISKFRLLPRVTSDCRPFTDGGRLFLCVACGGAQSPSDQQWFDEIERIYSVYRAFQQYGGPEQHVLDGANGKLKPRSQILLERLYTLDGFPQKGDILDVGCGGGATLRAFSERGRWRLFGLEIDDRDLPLLRSVPGFDSLYTCKPADLPRQFDVVTMVHSLEHFPEPVSVLRDLHTRIARGGRLFVEVPDADANPFEYLVADHMVHFTSLTLQRLATSAGFAVDSLCTDWVSKELSLAAYPAEAEIQPAGPHAVATVISHVRQQIAWIGHFLEAAREASSTSAGFGLFGSTIVATWLCGALGGAVSFFVEEDANRVGGTHMGLPILSPAQVPRGSIVFMSLIPRLAAKVAARLADLPIELRLPPE